MLSSLQQGLAQRACLRSGHAALREEVLKRRRWMAQRRKARLAQLRWVHERCDKASICGDPRALQHTISHFLVVGSTADAWWSFASTVKR